MAIKVLKPTTPGRRQMSVMDFSAITKTKPEKRLVKYLKKTAGRNNQGKKTIGNSGGGHKRKYRKIDFKRIDKLDIPGKISAIEYDPNRNALITLVTYSDGEKRYHLCPDGLKVGDSIITAEKAKIKTGNRVKIKNIPPGFDIYNIELMPGKGGQIVRSAGTSAKISTLEGKHAQIILPSGEIRLIPKDCYASIGKISNEEIANITIGKAGRSRWKNIKPHVRGKAKNPVDHPHGGGEGNQSIGLKHPKTPWGMPALGFKTRKRKYSNVWIVKSRKKKK